jgi:hypothetical protein
MASPTLITDLGRVQEAGRIRIGEKHGRAMRSIDKFRFTSPDNELLGMLAERYGGEVRPWSDPKANPNNQFELYSEADTIDVVVANGGIDTNYELWTGRGLQRQCDGETCTVQLWDGENVSSDSGHCLCAAAGVMECKIQTRVAFMFDFMPFRGMWRLDTKSWNAAHEMPSMMAIMDQLRERKGLAQMELSISKESKIRNGKKAHFVVPKLRFKQSLMEMVEGKGVLGAKLGTGKPEMVELEAPAVYADPDLEVVEAEVIE